MTKIFGLPILIAILLGILFPYFAMTLISVAFVFLFLIIIWAGLTIEWDKLSAVVRHPLDILVGLLFLFGVFPLIQWVLAKALISDRQILYGLVFTSLTPAAVVAPFFTKIVEGDEELSFLIMVCSMIICPFISPVLLKVLTGAASPVETGLLFKNMLLLVTLPLVLSYLVSRFLPKLKRKLVPALPILNILCLSILVYILWGTLMGRLNLSYTTPMEIATILALVFFQDFGVLVLSRLSFAKIYRPATANALIMTLSMKNVAVAAGLLLFYDPRASFPAALAFIAHAFLFNFIPVFRRMFIH